MSILVLALLLAAQPVQSSAEPDFVATLHSCCGDPTETIRSHAGRVRWDRPEFLNPTHLASTYYAPGQRASVTITRDSTGEVIELYIAANGADEGRSTATAEKTLQPVPASDVTPPLDLLDLEHWLPPGALRDRGAGTPRDYVATFARYRTTITRSGGWVKQGDSLTNDQLGVFISRGPDSISIRRFNPHDHSERRFGSFTPATVKGRSQENLFGQTCRWMSRPSSIDAEEYQCQTADGAVLAFGQHSLGFDDWEPAASFKRGPVPLASILPPPAALRPEHYGLSPSRRSDHF